MSTAARWQRIDAILRATRKLPAEPSLIGSFEGLVTHGTLDDRQRAFDRLDRLSARTPPRG